MIVDLMRRIVALASLIAALAAPRAARAWAIGTVDPTQNSGWYVSLRLDSYGAPHVAYWTPGVGVRIATFDGVNWSYELFPGPDAPATGPERIRVPGSGTFAIDRAELLVTEGVSFALGPDDQPWLAHVKFNCFGDCSGTLRVSHRNGTSWTTDDFPSTRERPDIEVGPDTVVHVRCASTTMGLLYAMRSTSGTWTTEPVYFTANSSRMRLDPLGRPHMVWSHGDSLWHAVRANGAWQIVSATVVPSPGLGSGILAMALTKGGDARIVYDIGSGSPSTGMWYAEENAAGWTETMVAPGTNAGVTPDLAVDPVGDPFVAYEDQAGLDLRSASRKGGDWTLDTIDFDGNTGYWPSIAFDPSGAIVAYQADYGYGTRIATGGAIAGVSDPRRPARVLCVRGENPIVAGGSLRLTIEAPSATRVALQLFDVTGRRIAARGPEAMSAGVTRIEWAAGAWRPGVYLVRATSGIGTAAARIVALR
jgi:hypothetical protein